MPKIKIYSVTTGKLCEGEVLRSICLTEELAFKVAKYIMNKYPEIYTEYTAQVSKRNSEVTITRWEAPNSLDFLQIAELITDTIYNRGADHNG
jgi:hypothetical protein